MIIKHAFFIYEKKKKITTIRILFYLTKIIIDHEIKRLRIKRLLQFQIYSSSNRRIT